MKGHESLAEPGFRRIAQTHPGVVIQCPTDFLAPLAAAAHEDAERMLERLRSGASTASPSLGVPRTATCCSTAWSVGDSKSICTTCLISKPSSVPCRPHAAPIIDG